MENFFFFSTFYKIGYSDTLSPRKIIWCEIIYIVQVIINFWHGMRPTISYRIA